MNTQLSRRQTLAALPLGCVAPLSFATSLARANERRPDTGADYRLEFTHDREDLIGDLLHGERGAPHRESSVPHGEWYSHRTRHRDGAWGPPARRYEPFEAADRSVEWKRERVIANAARFIGYSYQHHHIPDWDPPSHWPWKQCCAGHNGKGVDCSNFTSFVYNQAFGIHMSSGIGEQAEISTAFERGGHSVHIERIDLPESYEKRQEVLKTGDLLYIRHAKDKQVSHVIFWVGLVGVARSGVPLIMDSHGGDVKDDEGRPIPCGIHLRPFRRESWYNECASHAHRIFVDRA